MPRVHDYVLSAACYKARLFMSLLGIAPEIVAVDYFPGRQHLSPEYLALNPAGDLPILEDGGEIIAGAEVILVHLARRYDTADIWQATAAVPWLAFSANDLAPLAKLRLHDLLGLPCDEDTCRRAGLNALRRLDDDRRARNERRPARRAGHGGLEAIAERVLHLPQAFQAHIGRLERNGRLLDVAAAAFELDALDETLPERAAIELGRSSFLPVGAERQPAARGVHALERFTVRLLGLQQGELVFIDRGLRLDLAQPRLVAAADIVFEGRLVLAIVRGAGTGASERRARLPPPTPA